MKNVFFLVFCSLFCTFAPKHQEQSSSDGLANRVKLGTTVVSTMW